MEELTIEQKAKRYDEAIKKARALNSGKHIDMPSGDTVCECLFPEIKESEDVLTWLKNYISEEVKCLSMDIRDNDRITLKKLRDSLVWLEKYSESDETKAKVFLINKGYPIDANGIFPTYEEMYNIIREGLENQGEQKPTDKVEPKFKVGDWVVKCNNKNFCKGNKFAQITKIDLDKRCWFDCGTWLSPNDIRHWSITDAKNGDILTSPDNKAFIYNGNFDTFSVGAYCGLDINNNFVIVYNKNNWCYNHNIKPATKEERQTLFNEMNLLGWVWNPETKELNRLEKDEKL